MCLLRLGCLAMLEDQYLVEELSEVALPGS